MTDDENSFLVDDEGLTNAKSEDGLAMASTAASFTRGLPGYGLKRNMQMENEVRRIHKNLSSVNICSICSVIAINNFGQQMN